MVKKLLTEISEAEYHPEEEEGEFAGFIDNGDIFAGDDDDGAFADFHDDGDVFAEETQDEKE